MVHHNNYNKVMVKNEMALVMNRYTLIGTKLYCVANLTITKY